MTEFNTPQEVEDKLKSLGFSTRDRKNNLKPLLYKGILTKGKPVECALIGVQLTNTYETLVINVNGKTHYINPDYLKDMQRSSFSYAQTDKEQ